MVTKNDMARVIVQALYNEDYLPPADNKNVQRMARAKTKKELEKLHKTAVNILQQKL